jgi:hypothetical protein
VSNKIVYKSHYFSITQKVLSLVLKIIAHSRNRDDKNVITRFFEVVLFVYKIVKLIRKLDRYIYRQKNPKNSFVPRVVSKIYDFLFCFLINIFYLLMEMYALIAISKLCSLQRAGISPFDALFST